MLKKQLGQLLPGQRNLAHVKRSKEKLSGEELNLRKLTVQQFSVLLFHFYIGISDPEIYYEDAEISPERFQNLLDQEVELEQGLLERLMYYSTLANETRTFWHPASDSYEKFIQGILIPGEKYDKLLNLILEINKG